MVARLALGIEGEAKEPERVALVEERHLEAELVVAGGVYKPMWISPTTAVNRSSSECLAFRAEIAHH
jgi:hypothetical protein